MPIFRSIKNVCIDEMHFTQILIAIIGQKIVLFYFYFFVIPIIHNFSRLSLSLGGLFCFLHNNNKNLGEMYLNL